MAYEKVYHLPRGQQSPLVPITGQDFDSGHNIIHTSKSVVIGEGKFRTLIDSNKGITAGNTVIDTSSQTVPRTVSVMNYSGSVVTVPQTFGSTGMVLTSTGAATAPTFQTAAGSAKAMLARLVNNSTVGSATTTYLGTPDGSATSAENQTEFLIPAAGTVKNLYVQTATNSINNNTVWTVRKNAANTALTTTVATTVLTGNDTTHSFTVAAADRITLLIDTTAAGSGSLTILSWSVEIDFT